MRIVLTLFVCAVSLSLSAARQRTDVLSSSTVRTIGQPDHAQLSKSPDNEKYIKRVQILNQIGLDGKVQKIRTESDEEDKPGIRAYGLQKKRLQDNGAIERVYIKRESNVDDSKSGRLVEAYGLPKINVKTNGFIEKSPLPNTDQSARLESQHQDIRARRSVRIGSENKVEEKTGNEAEDMEAQDAKVFRPLFVYRQQVAARERRKQARNVAHRNHRHAIHQPCNH
ncbi:uncharacterized protein [Linepithema humile]|uniref:uncharacterized protein n=1 Tax=Linepithema humile TaxID=83485 RepID=UPI000623AC28|nr:PREDICTED: uncharacterized protein LOC105677268 [Linepithema humile]